MIFTYTSRERWQRIVDQRCQGRARTETDHQPVRVALRRGTYQLYHTLCNNSSSASTGGSPCGTLKPTRPRLLLPLLPAVDAQASMCASSAVPFLGVPLSLRSPGHPRSSKSGRGERLGAAATSLKVLDVWSPPTTEVALEEGRAERCRAENSRRAASRRSAASAFANSALS